MPSKKKVNKKVAIKRQRSIEEIIDELQSISTRISGIHHELGFHNDTDLEVFDFDLLMSSKHVLEASIDKLIRIQEKTDFRIFA
jgi:hypothetical protein